MPTANHKYSAVSRRFSPDMRLRWMPTIDGQIIAGGTLPFSGFGTRAEAIAAAARFINGGEAPKRQRPYLRLIDGPLVDNRSEGDILIEAMANDLIHDGTANDEAAATRSLRGYGYAPADIIVSIDDARNLALCGIVSAEMSS